MILLYLGLQICQLEAEHFFVGSKEAGSKIQTYMKKLLNWLWSMRFLNLHS